MNVHLLVHNLIFLVGGLINIGIAFFVISHTRKQRNVTALTFALSSLAVAVFQLSQFFGVNAADATTSRNILMFNLADIFIGMFMTHWFLGLIGKDKEQRKALYAVYASGLSIFIACLIFPRLFLVNSVPKLYLPFYYEPGPLYAVMVAWFAVVSVYHFYQLYKAHKIETNPIQKKRYRYTLSSMVYAYILGTTAFLLVFDIPFDPALSSFFGLYPLFLAYTIIQYELLNIRILAKNAFIYISTIFSIAILIVLLNSVGKYILDINPDFPEWLLSLFVSALIGTAGVYVWKKSRETEMAKYEFITVVTHKFRTPLTKIKWMSEEIRKALPPDKKDLVDVVEESQKNLLELTDLLVRLSESDGDQILKKREMVEINNFVSGFVHDFEHKASQKKLSLVTKYGDEILSYVEKDRLGFVLQIILENSINYTREGGTITIRTKNLNDKSFTVEVSDTGVGIPKETLTQLFGRFYRGDKARILDTEGMGIGLYMAKRIIEKQGGNINAYSEGLNRGSTFTIMLPIFK